MLEGMNPELRIKWIVALRSGKYNQGFKALHCKTEHCIFGVLLDISGIGNWEISSEGRPNKYTVRLPDSDPCEFAKFSVSIPFGILPELGISSNDYCLLIKLNDIRQDDFNFLATFIENNYSPVN